MSGSLFLLVMEETLIFEHPFFLRARASPPPVESLKRIESCMTGGFGWPDITRFIPRVLRLAAAINLFLASTFDDPLSLIASHQNRQEDVIYNPFLFPASLFPLHSLFCSSNCLSTFLMIICLLRE